MAAPPWTSYPGTSYVPSYGLVTAEQQGQSGTEQRLPSGPCNYRDLSSGSNILGCGCCRFSLTDVDGAKGNGEVSKSASTGALCFCGHHACFHDLQQAPARVNAITNGLNNGQIPHHTYNDWEAASTVGFEQWTAHQGPADFTELGNVPPCPGHPGAVGQQGNFYNIHPSGFHKPSPSTLPPRLHAPQPVAHTSGLGLYMDRNGSATSDRGVTSSRISSLHRQLANSLPSTQSPLRPPTSHSSEVEQRLRSSPGTAFQDHVDRVRSKAPPLDVPLAHAAEQNEEQAQSATEVATPSNNGTPALNEGDEAFNTVKHDILDDGTTLGHVHGAESAAETCTSAERIDLVALRRLSTQLDTLRSVLQSTPDVKSSLMTLSNRIDALESASFSFLPVEELQDKLETFDGRLLDLEYKIQEYEDTKGSQNLSIGHGHSFEAGTSFDSAKFQDLERRLLSLESVAPPNPASPWKVEVVFLPWGRDLQGVWMSALEASQRSVSVTQDSGLLADRETGSHVCGPRRRGNETPLCTYSEWVHDSPTSLYPRACGPSHGVAGKVYGRLRSRGFVQTVRLTANAACRIESTVAAAFAGIFDSRPVAQRVDLQESNTEAERYLGLKARFIPLRKIHKSSRLQFLSPTEMTTQSMWTADFLNSSVFMKIPSSGTRRLFITEASSYLQHKNESNPWTWQKIRELPRFQPSSDQLESDSSFVGEADALEPCWTWDSRLDPPANEQHSAVSRASHNSSFASSHPISPDHSQRDDSPLPGSGFSADIERMDGYESDSGSDDELGNHSDELEMHDAPITPISEFPSRIGRFAAPRRTSSVPLGEFKESAVAVPKRQAASFEQSVSPVKSSIPKRRRLSKASDEPGFDTNVISWNLTPRRSREPPSPNQAQEVSTLPSNVCFGAKKTGSTPLAYATPYSYNVTMDEDFGDTDVDSDEEIGESVDSDVEQPEYDGWEGMNDADEEEIYDERDASEQDYD